MTTTEERKAVLKALELAWERHPSLRLCQLIVNVAPTVQMNDPYYLTDKTLLQLLSKY